MEKLIDLIRQFDRGDIALPEMQREFVWQPPKVEKLLDSLYKGWPVGSFYLWLPSLDFHMSSLVIRSAVRSAGVCANRHSDPTRC
jgi:uncharacterized protein with ParB-like and HNH nuclease domain